MARLVRCRDAAWLYRLLADTQPRSTPLLGAAMAGGLSGSSCRAVVSIDEDARCGGAVVLRRWMPGRWVAHAVVLDPVAAPGLGAVVNASPAHVLQGFSADLEPLRPFVSRWRGASTTRAASLAPGFEWPDPPPTTRLAVPGDAGRITDVAWRSSPHAIPWRWLLGRRVRAAIAEGAVVVEAGDPPVIAGYAALGSRTPSYDLWAHVVVDPAFRGQRLSWDLVAAAAGQSRRRGAGVLVMVVTTNPMTVPGTALMADTYATATLAPRGSLRSHRA